MTETSPAGGSALFQLDPDDQIKHRDRVRDLAEVYTHQREVAAMLDLVPDVFPSSSSNASISGDSVVLSAINTVIPFDSM